MPDTLYPFTIDFTRLAEPFPPDAVSWRVGATNSEKTKGLALAYIDARDVMARLDEVCGPANWQDEYTETPKGRVLCRIGIRCGTEWVWKTDGAGDSDVEADKGAISDALKRAAVKWGVGRYLYSLSAPWVEIETRGKTSIIKDSERAKLARVAAAGGAPLSPPAPRQQPSTNASQAKKADVWPRFVEKLRGFTDLDELERWWSSASTQSAVDAMPGQWPEQAHEEYEKHQEKLMQAGAP